MNRYAIKVESQKNAFIAWGVLVVFIVAGTFCFSAGGGFFSVRTIFYGFSLLIFIWLLRKTATANMEWAVDDKGVYFYWLTQFIGQRQQHYFVPWSEVENYRTRRERTFNTFVLRTTGGKKFTFYCSRTECEYLLFLTDFERRISGVLA